MDKKTFEEYMTEFNPDWKRILPFNIIKKAKYLYELKDCYQEMNKVLINKQFNKLGIDYTKDFMENNIKLGNVFNQLKNITLMLKNNEISNDKIKILN
ncbi:MAG: hypothetical protein J6G98_01280 [Bacilli bacterium]|nr:hypothetical protein [Bacilli bacterium]